MKISYRNLILSLLTMTAIDTGLWFSIIVVGLMGTVGSMSTVQCTFVWLLFTATAIAAKILICLNLLQTKEKAARCNGRQRNTGTNIITPIVKQVKEK